MDTDEVIALVRRCADPLAAQQMASYMRDLFPFLGIARSRLTPLIAPYIRASSGWDAPQVLDAVSQLWAQSEREFVYIAVALIQRRIASWPPDAVTHLLDYVDRKAWWDSVDALRKPIGMWARANPADRCELQARLLAGSMWQRRVAITLQLQWKQSTDTALLAQALDANLTDPQFFIEKAIGWALRDLSKTDPQWVAHYLASRAVQGLALREAARLLPSSIYPARSTPQAPG